MKFVLKIFLFLLFQYSLVQSQSINDYWIDSSKINISITAVGDLMCHSGQYKSAHVAADSFNFNPVYDQIKMILESSDFAIGNFETVTAGQDEGYSGYPFFNTPDDYITGVKYAGFDYVTTTNNHCLDRGEDGLRRTIKNLTEHNINYAGTFTSKRDQDSTRIFNIKGIKIAILPYSYGTNGVPIPGGKDYLVNLIDFDQIENDIKKARSNGAEIVIVHLHYGQEYKREPVAYQREVVNNVIKFGADIIIGGLPHVIQPFDYFKTNNATLDTGFVAYSLGNFISNQYWRYSDAGVILKLNITKDLKRDSIYIDEIEYLPTWVFRGNSGNRQYKILPAELSDEPSLYPYLSFEDRRKMKEAFGDTKDIVTRYTNKKVKIINYRKEAGEMFVSFPVITF